MRKSIKPLMNQTQLIKGISKGDRKALRHVYDHYGGLFLGIAYRYFSDLAEAEDIVQETFVKIYKNIKSFKKEGSFEGWMKRILVNNCLNRVKSLKPQNLTERLDLGNDLNLASLDDDAITRMNIEEIMKVIHQLPVGYRTVLNLYVFDGYSHKEISEMLGIQESASRSQLLKARKKLKLELVRIGVLDSEKVA